MIMESVLEYTHSSGRLDPTIARFLMHLALSPMQACRDDMRGNAIVVKLLDISKSSAAQDADPDQSSQSSTVQQLAGSDVKQVERTRALTQLHSVLAAVGAGVGPGISATVASKWPGGRHRNDHADYRQIQLPPIVEELQIDGAPKPFMPALDGSDQFLSHEVRMNLTISNCAALSPLGLLGWSAGSTSMAGSCQLKLLCCNCSHQNSGHLSRWPLTRKILMNAQTCLQVV
jgi:hypothetical protein